MRGNLWALLPPDQGQEVFETLCQQTAFKVQRIVSYGHASAEWYDSAQAEWVVLLKGEARVQFADQAEPHHLQAGDWLAIAPHQRHQVQSTSSDALWLAIHYVPN